ncbi:hypothetical protein E1B28_002511 [Marasmius oreades]|nr:uncharacterized protein E1B28_002511 [Marasmius oreades]KAG7086564.1 hypothetical protein E1B28_002511 [Marasmius oreades]
MTEPPQSNKDAANGLSVESFSEPKVEPKPLELEAIVHPEPPVASSSTVPPSPSVEGLRTPRKSSTFRRVVPRKNQPQTPTKNSTLPARQNVPASSSPLSRTANATAIDDRPLPQGTTANSEIHELVMPKPIQLAPPPRTSSLVASTLTNGVTSIISSPPITVTSSNVSSQPSSPTRLSPSPSVPVKVKSALKRAPYRPGFQPHGSYRPRTDEFLAMRRVARHGTENDGQKRVERTKLERRLEKLISLHFPEATDAKPVVLERRLSSIFDVSLDDIKSAGGSALWKGVVGGHMKNDLRASEQRITPWQEDSEVNRCPICSSSFHPLSNRKHHCRLCGKIICNLPVKHPIRAAQCSTLFVVDPKTRRIEEVGEGVDYGVRKRASSHEKRKDTREEEEEKFLKGVRICRDCRPILLRQQYIRETVVVPTFVRLYDAFIALEKEIEASLPHFQEMVLSLGQDSSPQTVTKEATATRKRLLDAFAQYDALAKRIRMLPGNDGSIVKQGSSQDRVQMAITTRASIFLQKNMFPLQSLPKRSTSTSNTPGSTSPTPEGANTLPLDIDSQLAHVLQPLLEQEALLETFVEEATAQRKFEDAKSLRANLKEIREEIDRVLKAADTKSSRGK